METMNQTAERIIDPRHLTGVELEEFEEMEDYEYPKIRLHALKCYYENECDSNKLAQMWGVSPQTVESVVLTKDCDTIPKNVWYTISKHVGYSIFRLKLVETTGFNKMMSVLEDAALDALAVCIVADAGAGKSRTLRHFLTLYPEATRIVCSEYWNRKTLMEVMCEALGEDASAERTVHQINKKIIKKVKNMAYPVFIWDEIDKLNDQALHLFITLYNQFEDHAGFALVGTPAFKKRLENGAEKGKRGYPEVYSRVGRKIIEIDPQNETDVTKICKANGITQQSIINDVWNDCQKDGRRVRRKIYSYLYLFSNEN